MIDLLLFVFVFSVAAIQVRPVEEFVASLERVPYLKPIDSLVDNDLFFDRAASSSVDVLQSIPPPYCANSLCGKNSTCCLSDTGKPSCFAGANDTCCGVENFACPNGYVCDPIKKDCAK
jgi:hypothetical protein